MPVQINKTHRNWMNKELKYKTENDDYIMNDMDSVKSVFYPLKSGIKHSGLNINHLKEILNFKDTHRLRVLVCQFQAEMIKSGIWFGGIKDGKLKLYGWPKNENEILHIINDRVKRIKGEAVNLMRYIDDKNGLHGPGLKMIKECTLQLELGL